MALGMQLIPGFGPRVSLIVSAVRSLQPLKEAVKSETAGGLGSFNRISSYVPDRHLGF